MRFFVRAGIWVYQKRLKTIFGILFSGDEHPTTEAVIEKMSGVPVLGRIDEEPYFDKMVVKEYAELLKEILSKQ